MPIRKEKLDKVLEKAVNDAEFRRKATETGDLESTLTEADFQLEDDELAKAKEFKRDIEGKSDAEIVQALNSRKGTADQERGYR